MPEHRDAEMRVFAGGEPKSPGQGSLTPCAIGTGAVMAKHPPGAPARAGLAWCRSGRETSIRQEKIIDIKFIGSLRMFFYFLKGSTQPLVCIKADFERWDRVNPKIFRTAYWAY